MRNLIDFLVKYSSWFVFAFYVVVSCVLLFNRNPYQHHIYMTSAGAVASSVYDVAGNVTSYFGLRQINEDLQHQNALLSEEVVALRNQVKQYQERYYGDTMTVADNLANCKFIIAGVINNSINHTNNFITIDKGSNDSIAPEMGVVDQNGLVGVVNVVGNHYSRIISLLNPDLSISCKVKGNDAFGSLMWDGKTYKEAILEGLPRHTVYEIGDTVVTSGFSAIFPEGIPVATVIGTEKTIDDNFYTLRVKLLTDFSRLSTVRIISRSDIDEIREVEQ